MSERITGFILLIAGLAMIAYSCLSVIFVFTGKSKPANLFDFQAITLDLSGLLGTEMPAEQSRQIADNPNILKTELIKGDLLNKPLNLVANLMLMGFILSVGYKISSLGIQLLRPIKVSLKSKVEVEKEGGEVKNG